MAKRKKRKAYKRSWETFLTDKRVQWNMYRTYTKWYKRNYDKYGSNMSDMMSYADWVEYMKTAAANRAIGEKLNVRTEAAAHILTTGKQAKSFVDIVKDIQDKALEKIKNGDELSGTERLVIKHFGIIPFDEEGNYTGLTSYDIRAKTDKYQNFYDEWKRMKEEKGYIDDDGNWQDINIKDEEIYVG